MPFFHRLIRSCDEHIYKYESRLKGHDATTWVNESLQLMKYQVDQSNQCSDQVQINVVYMEELYERSNFQKKKYLTLYLLTLLTIILIACFFTSIFV